MPIQSQPPTFIIDNGAHSIKAGFGTSDQAPVTYPNWIARSRDRKIYVADEYTTQCQDESGVVFRRPFERGHLTSWETQNVIWDRLFANLKVNPADSGLTLTEPILTMPSCSNNTDQIVFEEYGFAAYYKTSASVLAYENENAGSLIASHEGDESPPQVVGRPDTVLVIDSGYSATTITPIISNLVYRPGIKRLNIGGKLLRNLLKETISYRHYNMMEDSEIVNHIKEQACLVSSNFTADLEISKKLSISKNPLRVDYVLPRATPSGFVPGHVRDSSAVPSSSSSSLSTQSQDEQVLQLVNERFSIPEVLFNPQDIGIQQAGLPEAVLQATNAVPDEDVRALLLSNIIVIGGNTKFPGFSERLRNELRVLAPGDVNLRLGFPDDPITYAWHGGASLASRKAKLKQRQVTRKEYQEYGINACLKKFGRLDDDVEDGGF
ncbi:actin family [Lipomyces japonicus]|uniref:actin family n=1 Tax=Lipomyces japonicus TaxID=56871 RepID=UPI0034CE2A07